VPGTDFNAVVNRRISVTPIHLDLTGRRLMRQLQDWDWSLDGPAAAVPLEPAGAIEEARLAEETQIERR
jgi:hypothetical protein